MKRKEFIQACIRIGILGSFFVLVGIFVRDGKITRRNECTDGFQCQGCSKRKKCLIPESEKYKKHG